MKLEKIITLANAPVRLRFVAMERSLRATGCDLPLLVIPYDDQKFDLPPKASWWSTEIGKWITEIRAHRMMSKYQCLTTENYQFVDSDIIFMRNPADVLNDQHGFISSCCHWNNTNHTTTAESLRILCEKSTCWPRNVFNAGQFACDRAIYDADHLRATCMDPRYMKTALLSNDQTGLVLLANLTSVGIYNLTLPPVCMESTWAGDYITTNYERYWSDETKKPYLIHWAGCDMSKRRPIDDLFTNFLTKKELEEWNEQVARKARRKVAVSRLIKNYIKGFIRK